MKEDFKTRVNIQKLEDNFQPIETFLSVNEQSSYLQSYPAMLAFFNDKQGALTENDFVVGAHMVYGWMPTIITFNKEKMNDALSAINRAKNGELLTADELEAIKSCVNNSMVGASKLLHFINPQLYAIWDSKVCRYITGVSHQQKVNSVANYLLYLDLCRHITSQKEFATLYSKAKCIAGIDISAFRAVELIMFMNGAGNKQSAIGKMQGEGSPFLEESEDSKLYNCFASYELLTKDFGYSHEKALEVIGISDEEMQKILKRYSNEGTK